MSRLVAALKLLPRVGIAICLLCIATFGLLVSYPNPDLLRDFGSFLASGQAAAAGLDPYGNYPPLTFYVTSAEGGAYAPNLNPPISVLIFQCFATTDPATAFLIWYAISATLFLIAIGLLIHTYGPHLSLLHVLWVFALTGLWHTLRLGQIYMPLLLVTIFAWLLLRSNRRLLAGVCVGLLIAIKPNFILWPLLLLIAGGYLPMLIATLATVVVVSLIPLLVYGPIIYQQWIPVLASSSQGNPMPSNASLAGFLARMGLAEWGTIVSALLVLGIAIWCWRIRPDVLQLSAIGICTTLLASPIAWDGYTLLLVPVFFALCWSWPMVIAAILLLVPVDISYIFGATGITGLLIGGSVYFWALMAALGGLTLFASGRTNASTLLLPLPPANEI